MGNLTTFMFYVERLLRRMQNQLLPKLFRWIPVFKCSKSTKLHIQNAHRRRWNDIYKLFNKLSYPHNPSYSIQILILTETILMARQVNLHWHLNETAPVLQALSHFYPSWKNESGSGSYNRHAGLIWKKDKHFLWDFLSWFKLLVTLKTKDNTIFFCQNCVLDNIM